MEPKPQEPSSPFSVITRLLLAIESRLLSKRSVDDEAIVEELVEGLSSLSIPPDTAETPKSESGWVLEFPAVAAWIASDDGRKLTNIVTSFYEREAKRFVSRPAPVSPENLAEELRKVVSNISPQVPCGDIPMGQITTYGISRYKGLSRYWFFSQAYGNDGLFLRLVAFPRIYFSSNPAEVEEKPHQHEPTALDGRPAESLRRRIEDDFLRPACKYFPRLKTDKIEHSEVDKSAGLFEFRGIITRLHLSINRVAVQMARHSPVPSGDVWGLRHHFHVMFCCPVLEKADGQSVRGFRYALTDLQRNALMETARDGASASVLQQEIMDCRGKEFEKLKKRIREAKLEFPAHVSGQNEEEYVRDFVRWASPQPETCRDKLPFHPLRNLARLGATWLHTYSSDAQSYLLSLFGTGEVAATIEEVFIPLRQAELIGQILDYGDAEVIEEPFIIHPFSALPTDQMLNAVCSSKNRIPGESETEETLYPAFLHLIEHLLFPERFYLYPLIYADSPVLVCGVDADWIGPGRGKVVELLTDQAGALLLSTLSQDMLRFTQQLSNLFMQSEEGEAEVIMEKVEDAFEMARRRFELHASKEGEKKGVYAPTGLYGSFEQALLNFAKRLTQSFEARTTWLYQRWLRHEANNWSQAITGCCDDVKKSPSFKLDSPAGPPVERLEGVAALILQTTRLLGRELSENDKPIAVRDFWIQVKSVLKFLAFPSLDFPEPSITRSTLPGLLLPLTVELARNAFKHCWNYDCAAVAVELRQDLDRVRLLVRSEPHSASPHIGALGNLNALAKVGRRLPVGELEDKPLGGFLVIELAQKMGANIQWSWEKLDHEQIRTIVTVELRDN